MEVFVIMIQSIFHPKSQRKRTLRLLFEDCRFIYLHSLMRSDFLLRKGLLCSYDDYVHMVDISLASYRVKHAKINSIFTRAHVLFPIYCFL